MFYYLCSVTKVAYLYVLSGSSVCDCLTPYLLVGLNDEVEPVDRTIGQWMTHFQTQAGLPRLSGISESISDGLKRLAQQADQSDASISQTLQV